MWSKVLQWIAQFLLIPLIKEVATHIKEYIQRKLEQKKRHKENKEKVENYENNTDSSSADDFNKLP